MSFLILKSCWSNPTAFLQKLINTFCDKTVSGTNDITCQSAVFKGKNGIKRRTKGVIRLTVILFFYIIDKCMVSTLGIDFTKVYGLLGF